MARNESRLNVKITGDGRSAEQALDRVGTKAQGLTSKLGAISGAVATAFATHQLVKFVEAAADVEDKLSDVSTLLKGDTTVQMAELGGVISEIATEFGVLHSELGTQAYRAYSAGIKDVTEVTEVLTEASKLSYSAIGSVEDAMKVMVDSLRSYQKHGLEAAEAAGVVHNAIRIGITTLGEFGPALARVTTIAEGAGISFESLATAAAALTSTGLETTEAVTWLRGGIVGLTRGGQEFDVVMQHISETTGTTMKSFTDLVGYFNGDVQKAFKAVYDAVDGDQQKLLQLIGRVEGTQGVMSLATSTAEAYAEGMSQIADSVENNNEAFDKQTEDFNFQWKQVQIMVKDIVIMFGQELLPTVKELLNPVRDILTAVRGWSPELRKNVLILGGITTAVIALRTAVVGVQAAWVMVGRTIGRTNSAIGTSMKNTAGLTAGLLGATYVVDQLQNNFANLKHGWDTLFDGARHQLTKAATNISDWVTRPFQSIEKMLTGKNPAGDFFEESRQNEQSRYADTVREAYESYKRELKHDSGDTGFESIDTDELFSGLDSPASDSPIFGGVNFDDKKTSSSTASERGSGQPLIVHSLLSEVIKTGVDEVNVSRQILASVNKLISILQTNDNYGRASFAQSGGPQL